MKAEVKKAIEDYQARVSNYLFIISAVPIFLCIFGELIIYMDFIPYDNEADRFETAMKHAGITICLFIRMMIAYCIESYAKKIGVKNLLVVYACAFIAPILTMVFLLGLKRARKEEVLEKADAEKRAIVMDATENTAVEEKKSELVKFEERVAQQLHRNI